MTTITLPQTMDANVNLRWSSTGRDAARLRHDAAAANGTRQMSKAVLCQPGRHGSAEFSVSSTVLRHYFSGKVANRSWAAVLLSP